MNRFIKKLYRCSLAFIGLGLVSGCEKDSDNSSLGGPLAYGSPYSTFEMKGRVIDRQTGDPVKGVSLTCGYTVMKKGEDGTYIREYKPIPYSKLPVNEDGTFRMESNFSGHDNLMPVFFTDDDPEADGHYQDNLYMVQMEPVKKYDKENAFHTGHYKAKDVEIKVIKQ